MNRISILDTPQPTQYPENMVNESLFHKIAYYTSKKKKKLDYFAIGNAERVNNHMEWNKTTHKKSLKSVKVHNCNGISDHLPIQTVLSINNQKIIIISWNIQYFINEKNSGDIINTIVEIIDSQQIDNFIILFQEWSKNDSNEFITTEQEKKIKLTIELLETKYKHIGYDIGKKFQLTVWGNKQNKKIINVLKSKCIQRCLYGCIAKCSSLVSFFKIDKTYFVVNNIHLISPWTAFSKCIQNHFSINCFSLNEDIRKTEFKNILEQNLILLNKHINSKITQTNVVVLFGGDMNTEQFKKYNIQKRFIKTLKKSSSGA